MRAIVTAFLMVFAISIYAGLAIAVEKTPDQNSPTDEYSQPGNCPLNGFKKFKLNFEQPIPIPDNDPGGVTSPDPIMTPSDGRVIAEVIMDVQIDHTWAGDLQVQIWFEQGCDPTNVIGPVSLLDRPGVPESTFGCSGDLSADDKYFFGEVPGLAPLGELDCPPLLPHGCYAVAVESDPLSIFHGLDKDGCWWLQVIDNAGGDTGSIHNFSIDLRNEEPTPVERASWGEVKAAYRD